MSKNNLSKQEKLDILYGKQPLSELVKSRANEVKTIADILELEKDHDAGKIHHTGKDFVEKNGIIYSMEGFKDGTPATTEQVLEALDNYERIILHSADIIETLNDI